jgi:hypothetical protein
MSQISLYRTGDWGLGTGNWEMGEMGEMGEMTENKKLSIPFSLITDN